VRRLFRFNAYRFDLDLAEQVRDELPTHVSAKFGKVVVDVLTSGVSPWMCSMRPGELDEADVLVHTDGAKHGPCQFLLNSGLVFARANATNEIGESSLFLSLLSFKTQECAINVTVNCVLRRSRFDESVPDLTEALQQLKSVNGTVPPAKPEPGRPTGGKDRSSESMLIEGTPPAKSSSLRK